MNRITGFLLIIVIVFTQIGCWDVKDVADTAFITGIGLDASDKPDMIKVTFVMPKPSLIRNHSEKNFNIIQTVEAESIRIAIEKLETRLARSVRLGHLRVIVIGEKLSVRDFRGFSNLFEKTPEVALRTRIMFLQGGEAKELFNVSPIFNRGIAAELVGMAMVGKMNALEKTINFQGLRKQLFTGKGTVLTSRVIINKNNGKPFLEHEGGTVLKNWRVIGWLDENENRDAHWFLDGVEPKIVGKMGEGLYTFSVDLKSIKLIPKIDEGKIGFLVQVNAAGNVIEERFGEDLSVPKNMEKVEKMLASIVKDQVVNAVYKSQKQFKADYLGFGRALEIENPQLYRKTDWNKVYPNVPVTVKVHPNVHRFGKTK